jgi:DNA-binding NtrC family response regulator
VLFSIADKGTVLSNELASLPLAKHAKLLHALNMSMYSAVRSDRKISFDIKISSTFKTNMEGGTQVEFFRNTCFFSLIICR